MSKLARKVANLGGRLARKTVKPREVELSTPVATAGTLRFAQTGFEQWQQSIQNDRRQGLRKCATEKNGSPVFTKLLAPARLVAGHIVDFQ